MPDSLACTVLPTYNERDNIGPLIRRLLEANAAPYKILVVDDNSPDGTWQVVEAMAAEDPERVALVRRMDESGLTSAIQRGIDEAIDTFGAVGGHLDGLRSLDAARGCATVDRGCAAAVRIWQSARAGYLAARTWPTA